MSWVVRLRALSSMSLCVSLLFALGWSLPVSAQSHIPAARTIGLAGTSAASVAGTDAMFSNPARLGVAHDQISFSLGSFSVFAGGPLLQFKHYNDVFTSGEVISHNEGRRVVESWFGDPQMRTQKSAGIIATATPFAAAFRIGSQPFGIAVRSRVMGTLSMNGGWIDLVLVGMAEERSVPLNGSTGAALTTDIAVATSRKLRHDLTVGVTTRLVLGQEYAEARLESVAEISERTVTHTFDYVVRSAGAIQRDIVSRINLFDTSGEGIVGFNPRPLSVAGLGLGFDLGFDYQHSRTTNWSLSITDMGAIRWKTDARVDRPVNDTFSYEGIEFDLDTLRDQFENDVGAYIESKLDSLARDAYGESISEAKPFKRSLPTAIHVGFGHQIFAMRGRIDVGTTLPVNKAIGHTSRDPRLHVGFEYSLGRAVRIPLRTGFQVGGSGALALGFGFGIEAGPYAFTLGVSGSPRSDWLGAGGRYAVAVSALEFRF